MKLHTILKDFKGSQTGHDYHEFKAGTVTNLSNDLAAIAVKEGWAELAEPVAADSAADQHMKAAAEAARLKAEQEQAEQEALQREAAERKQHEIDEQLAAEAAARAEEEARDAADREKAEAEARAQAAEEERLAAVAQAEADQKAADEQTHHEADSRETKVVGPEETKVIAPPSTKSLDEMTFAELKEEAKPKGIKTFGMSHEKLLAALKA